jgi:hypothetical protein
MEDGIFVDYLSCISAADDVGCDKDGQDDEAESGGDARQDPD